MINSQHVFGGPKGPFRTFNQEYTDHSHFYIIKKEHLNSFNPALGVRKINHLILGNKKIQLTKV